MCLRCFSFSRRLKVLTSVVLFYLFIACECLLFAGLLFKCHVIVKYNTGKHRQCHSRLATHWHSKVNHSAVQYSVAKTSLTHQHWKFYARKLALGSYDRAFFPLKIVCQMNAISNRQQQRTGKFHATKRNDIVVNAVFSNNCSKIGDILRSSRTFLIDLYSVLNYIFTLNETTAVPPCALFSRSLCVYVFN